MTDLPFQRSEELRVQRLMTIGISFTHNTMQVIIDIAPSTTTLAGIECSPPVSRYRHPALCQDRYKPKVLTKHVVKRVLFISGRQMGHQARGGNYTNPIEYSSQPCSFLIIGISFQVINIRCPQGSFPSDAWGRYLDYRCDDGGDTETKKASQCCEAFSAPVGIRTPNLLIRSQMLYPIELRVQRVLLSREPDGR